MTCRFLLFLRIGIEAPPSISVTGIITDIKIARLSAFVKHFLRMILKIVQIAVFSAPCFGVCAQFVRGAVREMRKKAGRAGTGGDGNTAAVNQSLLPEEKAGGRRFTGGRRFP